MTKTEKIIELLKKHPGLTSGGICKHIGSRIYGLLPFMLNKGMIVRRGEHRQYRYFAPEQKKIVFPKPSIPLSERIALMDAPVFAAVKRRQEAA